MVLVAEVRSVLAHFVHFALLWRPALPDLHAFLQFVSGVDGWRPWWPSALKESRVATGLLPLLGADLGRKTIGLVFATDASGPSAAVGLPTGAHAAAVGFVPPQELERGALS